MCCKSFHTLILARLGCIYCRCCNISKCLGVVSSTCILASRSRSQTTSRIDLDPDQVSLANGCFEATFAIPQKQELFCDSLFQSERFVKLE